jgi:hypothetical protein
MIWKSAMSQIKANCIVETQIRLYKTYKTQRQQLKLAALAIG